MADSLELVLQVRPASGDEAGELATWLRAELPDLDVDDAGWLPVESEPGATGPDGIAWSLLVRLDPKALLVVLTKVDDWAARTGRMVEIRAGDRTLEADDPARRQEKVVDGPSVPVTEVSRVRPASETEAAIEISPSAVPDRDSPAPEPGKVVVSLGPQGLSRRDGSADARLLLRGRINIEAMPGQEFRRTAAFAGISSLLASGFAILLSIAVLAAVKYHHGFSISTSYPVHRVYRGIIQYFIHITPPPGSPHMLLVYTVYLAILPVLFAVVFMHLKVGSTGLIVAVIACAALMAAPFIIAITSIRAGSANCGSWNYPEPHSGPECYNDLTLTFRIAFAVGIAGLAIPVIYLIRGRQQGRKNGLLLRTLLACAAVVMVTFSFISGLARGLARDRRDTTAGQNTLSAVSKYLLPHERQFIVVRRHPAVLIGPSILTVAGPVAAGVLTATVLNGHKVLITVVWIAWLILFFRAIRKTVNWAGTFFVVTSQRMLLTSGILTNKVEMLPLVRVTDMSFQRSFTGRLLGFGEFIIESTGSDRALHTVDHIPYPEQLYLEICGLIFRGREQDD
jgi:membrane protein YdbS with pleckstrin-like domain